MNLYSPSSPAELASLLKTLAEKKSPIETGGHFSKSSWGGPVQPAAARISTAKLNAVLQYEPRDLTISVGAGMPYADLTALLTANRQMIPLDPPYAANATVGGVIATNLSGPRRRLFGTARDLVIGMEFATLQGTLIQSGGMVVKNVAGLDMGKLLIGSYGTLGVMTSVNFKLIPLPPVERTFTRSFATAAEAVAERNRLIQGVLQPAGIDILNPAASERVGQHGFLVIIPVGGSAVVMKRYEQELASYSAAAGEALFSRVCEFSADYLREHPKGRVVRAASRLQGLQTLLDGQKHPVVARAANGVSYVHLPDQTTRCEGLVEAGVNGSAEAQWKQPGSDFVVMEKIKRMLDPEHLLNKGRLYGRI